MNAGAYTVYPRGLINWNRKSASKEAMLSSADQNMLKYVKYASVWARGLALAFFDLGSLDLPRSCRSFSNSLLLSMASGIFAGLSACPSSTSFEEAVELLIMKGNLDALFHFCHHVESMTIDWYHEVILLDPRLLAIKFCFHFCYFTKSFLHKKVSH